jgi:hypothetical protein
MLRNIIATNVSAKYIKFKNKTDRAREIYRGGSHKVLVGKHEGKRPLGRHRHKRYNIKMGLQEMGWGREGYGLK